MHCFPRQCAGLSKAFFQTPKAKQVVRAVVSMAHGMGLKVVAEGIETKEENHLTIQEGIDYIQGGLLLPASARGSVFGICGNQRQCRAEVNVGEAPRLQKAPQLSDGSRYLLATEVLSHTGVKRPCISPGGKVFDF